MPAEAEQEREIRTAIKTAVLAGSRPAGEVWDSVALQVGCSRDDVRATCTALMRGGDLEWCGDFKIQVPKHRRRPAASADSST